MASNNKKHFAVKYLECRYNYAARSKVRPSTKVSETFEKNNNDAETETEKKKR
ncbi:hypothetical protein H5410_010871 [Solanum commersonii]|uniref:Uncharacterized protein n=1 Tax=Solanum commersonii TaxID=4109 RepID=A0A9J6ALX9_SOLCO|nr:hypothetical protein H5410_010871 [Solanum commersonii]